MSQDSRTLDYLRILIMIFGFFLGGFWSNLFSDIIGSASDGFVKPTMLMIVLLGFLSFGWIFIRPIWAIALVLLVVDGAVALIFYVMSVILEMTAFAFQFIVAMITLVVLQVLVFRYVQKSDSR